MKMHPCGYTILKPLKDNLIGGQNHRLILSLWIKQIELVALQDCLIASLQLICIVCSNKHPCCGLFISIENPNNLTPNSMEDGLRATASVCTHSVERGFQIFRGIHPKSFKVVYLSAVSVVKRQNNLQMFPICCGYFPVLKKSIFQHHWPIHLAKWVPCLTNRYSVLTPI